MWDPCQSDANLIFSKTFNYFSERGTHIPHYICWMSEGNLWESVVSFLHAGSRDQTQAMRLCSDFTH